MARARRISLGVLAVFSLLASSAEAFHGRFGGWSAAPYQSAYYSYYYAPPVSYYYHCAPWYAPATVVPVPDARPYYAAPTPAPPSGIEPPTGAGDPRMPKITTTRSLGASVESSKQSCRVGFWNLAGHDVTLTIEGKTWSLPKNQVLTFTIDRQFTWQSSGQPQHVERVPEGQASYEVLVRE